jgi:hypothetical protein
MTFPQAVPVTAKVSVVIALIEQLGWDTTQESGWPLQPGPEIQTNPDRLLTITVTPGPGWITEEAALDCWGFQARLRGPENDPITPGLMIQRLDVMLLNGPWPQSVGNVVVVALNRQGTAPSPLPLDPGDRRFEYTCTYLITTGLE